MKNNEYCVMYIGKSLEPLPGSIGIACEDPYYRDVWNFKPDNSKYAYYVDIKELKFLLPCQVQNKEDK